MKYRSAAVSVVASASVGVGVIAILANLHYLRDFSTLPPAKLETAWLLPDALVWLVASSVSVWLLRRTKPFRPPILLGLVLASASVVYGWLELRYPHAASRGIWEVRYLFWASTSADTFAVMWLLYRRVEAAVLHLLLGSATVFVLIQAGNDLSAGIAAAWFAAGIVVGQWLKVELDQWENDSKMFARAREAASQFVSVNVRLQDSIDRTSGLTRLRERARIAREIHDSVGYTLTALLMQVQAAQDVLKMDPQALETRLVRLEEIIRSSIQEVRAEVSELRDESVVERSGSGRWRRLCESFADGTGVRVHTVMPESLEQVTAVISETVYRITQEALTNAYRHGVADYIDVSMAWESEARRILLRVSDNGRGAPTVKAGNGLRGIRERVSQLGGSVVWQSGEAKGFDLGVEIPWDGSPHE